MFVFHHWSLYHETGSLRDTTNCGEFVIVNTEYKVWFYLLVSKLPSTWHLLILMHSCHSRTADCD